MGNQAAGWTTGVLAPAPTNLPIREYREGRGAGRSLAAPKFSQLVLNGREAD